MVRRGGGLGQDGEDKVVGGECCRLPMGDGSGGVKTGPGGQGRGGGRRGECKARMGAVEE